MLGWMYVIVAVQSLFSVVAYISLSRRADVWEMAITAHIDQIIEAREEQKRAQEAQALQQAYGIPARSTRPPVMSRPLGGVPSGPRPRATMPPTLPPLEWEPSVAHQNGYTEWNG